MKHTISGFSLLEIMVGMAILAAGLMGTSAAMFTAINARDSSAERDLALQAIESTLEDILSNPFIITQDFDGSYPVRGLEVPPDSSQADVLKVTVTPMVIGGAPNNNILRVTLYAEWLHRGATEHMQLVFIFTNRGG